MTTAPHAPTDEIGYLTATDLANAYRSRSLSPVEVTRTILARIEALNPRLNAFCLIDGEAALRDARASEARWLRGEPLGPLDGVPASIKDLILTRGWPTLRGSRTVDPAGPWDADAPATARLREAGAVLLGKTNTPEFGWRATTDSPLTGITRNPWRLDVTPGGSSGGATAAVAAGLGPLAVGTDGGGSVRIPAAFTGTVGLKAQFGRVPAYPPSPMNSVAHIGPQTRTVEDCAHLLNVLARPDVRDWTSLEPTAHDWAADLAACGSPTARAWAMSTTSIPRSPRRSPGRPTGSRSWARSSSRSIRTSPTAAWRSTCTGSARHVDSCTGWHRNRSRCSIPDCRPACDTPIG